MYLRWSHRCVVAALLVTLSGKPAISQRVSDTELGAITERGRVLAEYDTSALHATDAVMATHPRKNKMPRYVAHRTEAGWVVDFGSLDESRTVFLVSYEAVQDRGTQRFDVKSFDPAREDGGWNFVAARGIENAMRDFGRVNRPYNIAALPAERDGMYVYFYPAQVKIGVYPFGGDIRYRISPDGTKIVEKRRMHRSIIESVTANAPAGATGGYHIHVLSDLPEDTDVLLVLTRKPRVPEIVAAGEHMFTIDLDGKISVANRPK